ncbi:MAG TPA: histidine kinase [Phaeodactylibacter sp.]|nr:histidine kinase [Phaeodactylibacter sp.]
MKREHTYQAGFLLSALLWLSTAFSANAQWDTIYLHSTDGMDTAITTQMQWLLDRKQAYDWERMAQLPSDAPQLYRFPQNQVRFAQEQQYWGRFCLCNTHPSDSMKVVIHSKVNYRTLLWQLRPGQPPLRQQTGYAYSKKDIALPEYSDVLPIRLPPHSCSRIIGGWYWRDYRFSVDSTKQTSIRLRSELQQANHHNERVWGRKDYMMTIVTVSILAFLSVFMGLQYWQFGDKAYGAYALYALSFCIYYLFHRNYWFEFPFAYLRPWREYLEPCLTMLIALSYVYFYQHFLFINPQNHPRIWKALRVAKVYILAVFVTLPVLWLLLPFPLAGKVAITARDFFFLIALYLVILVYSINSRLARIFLFGTLALVFFSLVMVFTDSIRPVIASLGWHLPKPELKYLSSTQSGILLESIIFALALSYRNRQVFEQKERAERQLQLSEDRLQRAQLSPHFIYNALNAIKYLLQQSKLAEASSYLSKFANLLRHVLAYLEQPRITLSEELKLSRQYLDVESLRFSGAFNYQIRLAPDIEPHKIAVPTLLLQPLLENAVIHGLMPKNDGNRQLHLQIRRSAHILTITIADNGIGRAAANQGSKLRERPSLGLALTRRRLQQWDTGSSLEVIDLKNKLGKASGTRLIIQLPLTTKDEYHSGNH